MNQSNEVTHDQVREATTRFLATGGHIDILPDTVDEQINVMRFEARLDGTGLEGADGLSL